MAKSRIAGITIVLEGDTHKLDTALKNTNKVIKDTQKELNDVNRLLKFDKDNSALIRQKQSFLKTEIEAVNNKLKTERDALEQLKNADKTPEVEAQMRALERQIADDEIALKKMNDELARTSVVGAKLDAVGQKLQDIGGKITDVGSSLTRNITAPIVALGGVAVTKAGSFEQAMSQIQATMGITKDSTTELHGEAVNTLEALGTLSRRMGEETKFSATESAEAVNILAMAGLSAEEIYDALPQVLNLAVAGSLDLASASTYVVASVKGMGDAMSNAQYYTDLFAKGATLANTDVNLLGEAFSGVSATAHAYGQTAEDVTVQLLRLANANVTGSQATTMLARMMADLYTPTDSAKSALDALGVSMYDMNTGEAKPLSDVLIELQGALSTLTEEERNNTLNTILSSNGLKAYNNILATSTEQANEWALALANANGSAEQQATIMQDNLQGQLTVLGSSLESLAISFGDILMPTIKDVVSTVQGLVTKLNEMDEADKTRIVEIAKIVATIGPLLIVIGTVITTVGKLATGISSIITLVRTVGTAMTVTNLTIVGIIAIIAGLIAIGVTLYQHWDEIKAKAVEIWTGITETFNKVKENITQAFDTAKANVSEAWDSMKNAIHQTSENIKSTVSTAFDAVKNKIAENGGGIKGIITTAWQGYKELWKLGLNFIDNLTGGKLTAIKDKFTEKFNAIKDFEKNTIEKIKGFFNFEWKLPDIKLPHFSISGSFSLMPPSVPHLSVDWYDKAMDNGMILNGATIFGAMNGKLLGGGETGSEVVVGTNALRNMIAKGYNDSAVVQRLDALTAVMVAGVDALERQGIYLDGKQLVGYVNRNMGTVYGG